MSAPAHTDLQAALDAEHAQRIALQHHAADQAQRIADLEAEIERITEARRAHIRRAAAFEAQRDELLACLRDCVEYVDEEELKHVAAYGEHHHAARLARVREDAKTARAAIAQAEGGAA